MFEREGTMVVLLEIVDAARKQIDAWLRGESEGFAIDPQLFGRPDAWEALETGDPEIFDLLMWMALASSLAVDEPTSAPPPPEPIRHAPFDLQMLWLAASSNAHSRISIGRTRIVVASDDLKELGLFEMTEEALADELARANEYEYAWHITPHTSSAKLAFHDWDGVFEMRWNRGDVASTIFHFDDEKGRNQKVYVSDFVLRVVLGTRWPDDTTGLKTKAKAEWNPTHRRLWELAAFLCGHRSTEDLHRCSR